MIIATFINNEQAYNCWAFPNIMTEIFNQTDRYGEVTKAEWGNLHNKLLTYPIPQGGVLLRLVEARYPVLTKPIAQEERPF